MYLAFPFLSLLTLPPISLLLLPFAACLTMDTPVKPAKPEEAKQQKVLNDDETTPDVAVGELLNVSGHVQEL